MNFDKFTDVCMTGSISHSPGHTSLRTANVFPIVASIFRMEGSDDRKYVCCSQATVIQTSANFSFFNLHFQS